MKKLAAGLIAAATAYLLTQTDAIKAFVASFWPL